MTSKEKKSKRTEIVLLSIFGAIWLFGFVLAILGVYAFNGPGKISNNPIYSAQRNLAQFLGMKGLVDFRIWGSIILVLAMIVLIGILYHYANKYDSIKAKKERTAERMKNYKMLQDEEENKVEEVASSPTTEKN